MKSNAEEMIRIEAYLLSEKAGHPAGMEAYFWQEAELIVAGRSGEKPAPRKRLAAKAKPKALAAPAKKAPKKKKKKE
jgi:hypothetical protein